MTSGAPCREHWRGQVSQHREGGDRALQGQAQTGGVMTMSNVVVLREPVAPKRQPPVRFQGGGNQRHNHAGSKLYRDTEPAQRDASLRRRRIVRFGRHAGPAHGDRAIMPAGFSALGATCDSHHKMSDLGAVSELGHSAAGTVEPVCPRPATGWAVRRFDGDFPFRWLDGERPCIKPDIGVTTIPSHLRCCS
jgi:hypothetical protein